MPKLKRYTEEDMAKAVEAVNNGELSRKRASSRYCIPRATLVGRLTGWKNRAPAKQSKPGRVPDLTPAIEEDLAENLKILNKWGFGLSRKEIINLVGTFVKENNIVTRFKDGVPGKDWFIGFCKRHNLSCKKPIKRQSIRTERTNPEILREFFQLYENTLNDLNLRNSPEKIFNIDETSLCSDPSNTKVVSERNKPVFRHTHGTGRTNTSILFCIAADGSKLPPFILYKAKNLWDQWMPSNAYPNTGYTATPHGWMTESSFFLWFKNHFIKFGPKKRPLLLIFDGHTSHVSVNLIKLAMEENITLLKLPPHTTHVLQPLDAVPFGCFKKTWDEELTKWQRENYGMALSKADLAVMVGKIWAQLPTKLIHKSFEITGLYPINSNAIDVSKYTSAFSNTEKKTNGRVLETDLDTSIRDEEIPSTSRKVGFEDLLLKKIDLGKKSTLKKRKISMGADIITREDFLKKLKQNEQNKILKKSKQGRGKISDSSSEESELEAIVEEGSSDYDGVNTLQELVALESNSLEDDDPTVMEMAIGSWVIVTYSTKKTLKRYVGKVLQITNETVEVKFVKKYTNYLFIWPNTDDVDTVDISDIYKVIPAPTEGRRGQLNFSLSFDGLNVE